MMDETLIRACVFDLNIVESQGPTVLVKACAAYILGMNIIGPGDIWQYLETFLVVATGAGKGARSCHWYLVSGGQG